MMRLDRLRVHNVLHLHSDLATRVCLRPKAAEHRLVDRCDRRLLMLVRDQPGRTAYYQSMRVILGEVYVTAEMKV